MRVFHSEKTGIIRYLKIVLYNITLLFRLTIQFNQNIFSIYINALILKDKYNIFQLLLQIPHDGFRTSFSFFIRPYIHSRHRSIDDFTLKTQVKSSYVLVYTFFSHSAIYILSPIVHLPKTRSIHVCIFIHFLYYYSSYLSIIL